MQSVVDAERLLALHHLVLRIIAEGSPDRFQADLLAEAVALLEGNGGAILRWDSSRGALISVRLLSPKSGARMVLRSGRGASGRAVKQQGVVVLNDYQRECGLETRAALPKVRAAVAGPLRYGGRLLGAIEVHSSAPDRQFSAEDAALMALLADLGAAGLVGLEQARLDGVLLAARTAQHELNNKLALTTGYAEMLSGDPALPPQLREAAAEALRGAEAAVSILCKLQRITHLEKRDWGPRQQQTIDINRSAN